MKSLAEPLLWLCTSALPFAIAACYGPPQTYSGAGGRVTDKASGEPVANLTVECLEAGKVAESALTDESGYYEFVAAECDEVRVRDADGAENGTYPDTTVAGTECPGCTVDVAVQSSPSS